MFREVVIPSRCAFSVSFPYRASKCSSLPLAEGMIWEEETGKRKEGKGESALFFLVRNAFISYQNFLTDRIPAMYTENDDFFTGRKCSLSANVFFRYQPMVLFL